MARFRGQTLYLRAATRDVAYGTNVRALISTTGADTNFTVTFTSTTAATQTLQPYTNISNNTTDNRTTHGWGMNQNDASADSVGSTSTRKRIIPAGTWSFSNALSGSAPPLLDSYNVTLEYSVYRVAANGGTRTLLFSFSGSAVNRSGSGAFTYTAISPSQPVYTLEPNETIHLAIRITSAATSSLLGGTTNTVITVSGATSGSQTFTIPAPGMRDLYFDTNLAVGSGVGSETLYIRKDIYSATGEGDGQYSRLVDFFRKLDAVGTGSGLESIFVRKDIFQAIGEGSGILSRRLELFRTLLGTGEGLGSETLYVRKDVHSAIGEGVGQYSRLVDFFRKLDAVGEGIGTRELLIIQKTLEAVGTGVGYQGPRRITKEPFLASGEGVGSRSNKVIKDIFSAIGEGDGSLERAVVFVRDFIATGVGVADISRVVIFVRELQAVGKGVVRGRIGLDFDDLPDPGGGGVTNVYRPLFVFDD